MVPNHARYHLRYTPKQLYHYNDTGRTCQALFLSISQDLSYLPFRGHTLFCGGDPMRRVRILLCALLFAALTFFKLLLPEARGVVLEQITRNDDYAAAADRVRAMLRLETEPASVSLPDVSFSVVTPLEEMEQARAAHVCHPFSELPGAQLHPTPSEETEWELSHAAAMDAAYAARETFLASQAAFSDRALPTNVSYDIPELPFPTVTPVAGYRSSGFGYRMHPIRQEVRFHYGTDFAANTGTEIFSFASGTVLAAGEDAGYGNYVKIDHGSGYVTLYGHCSALLVSAGDPVEAGQSIARVGATGLATGPHLHFELIHEGVYLNPEFYLAA